MPDKLYVVGIRWIKNDDDYGKAATALDPIANWARLNIHVWLVKSSRSAEEISDAIRRVIDPENDVFIISANTHDYHGFAPKIIWDWLTENF